VLTQAGVDVAALEAGPRLTREDFTADEVRTEVKAWLTQPKALHEVPTWRHEPAATAGPSPWPMLMVNAVGGTSVHYDALSIRFHPWNFESRTHTLGTYGAAAIPEGSTLVDWPFTYDDLESYYDLVEHAVGVSGAAGNVAGAGADPAGNRFEGIRSGPFPMPPLRASGWGQLMAGAAQELGWHPFPAPAAVNTRPYDDRPQCTYCGFCQGNGCYCDAKGAADVSVIRKAERTGRLRIETWASVSRIDVDENGRATGVTFRRGEREIFQPARVVLLGTFTYENTRLLLLSRSTPYPDGLSNNHRQVGRHYIAHFTPFVFGYFPGRRLNLFTGLGSQVVCVDDWNADNFDHRGVDFVGGGMITAQQELAPIGFAKTVRPPHVPRWGPAWKAWIGASAQAIGSTYAQFDALPYESNYLDLDPHVTDPYGVPVVRVTHLVHANEEHGFAFLRSQLHTWLQRAGAVETWTSGITSLDPRHCYGGTRMGDDPETSVVDGFGMSHEVPNLGVLGASTFPSAGGANPTLTVQATAWRTAQRVLDRWRAVAE
jgi:gluconate 2-dehydrogenase alpha chain